MSLDWTANPEILSWILVALLEGETVLQKMSKHSGRLYLPASTGQKAFGNSKSKKSQTSYLQRT